jgi:hypothetical protein
MPGTIRIERTGVGIELRRGSFTVELDGRDVGTLGEYKAKLELSVQPGPHTLQIRTGRYSSRPLELEIFNGGEINFRTHGAMLWPRYVASLIKPDWAISLHRY